MSDEDNTQDVLPEPGPDATPEEVEAYVQAQSKIIKDKEAVAANAALEVEAKAAADAEAAQAEADAELEKQRETDKDRQAEVEANSEALTKADAIQHKATELVEAEMKNKADAEAEALMKQAEQDAADAEKDRKKRGKKNAELLGIDDENAAAKAIDSEGRLIDGSVRKYKPFVMADDYSPHVDIKITCTVNGESKSCDMMIKNAAGNVSRPQFIPNTFLSQVAGVLKRSGNGIEIKVSQAEVEQEADAA